MRRRRASRACYRGKLGPPAPVLSSIAPTAGPTAGGNTVVFTGSNLSSVVDPDGVKFGAVDAASYIVDSPTQISAVPAAAAASTVNVSVRSAAGSSELISAYTFAAAPTATSVDPTTVAPEDAFETTGTNYIGDVTVQIKDALEGVAECDSINVTSPTTVIATVPAGTLPGTYDVRVTAAGGSSAWLEDALVVT